MKKFYRRSISGLLALLICFTTILSSGVTAFAASSSGETAKSYSVAFPRDGDANLDTSGTWGHDELHYMNGWTSGEKTWMTTLHTIGDFNGPACYCIEPGVPRLLERTYARYGEDYWKDYPSECNSTIDADTIKTLLGRIMQYGYQGNLSLGWRSQNDADADKLALMMATQVLVWETVVGERDANFNHVDPGGADAVKSVYRTSHPLYSRFSAYYDSIEASVKKHTIVPSFMARSTDKAQMVELSWDGSRYAITLTDTNGVLGDYTFSSEQTGITFVTSGNTLTITAETAPTETVTISATKNNTRKGVVVDEGIRLRCYGIRGDILILGFTDVHRARELKKYRLTQTLIDAAYAECLNQQGTPVRVHIGIDSGMHRLGFDADDFENIRQVFRMKNLKVDGMFTHLCCCESLEPEDVAFTKNQICRFYALIDYLKEHKVPIPKLHIQSSYGLLNYPELKCDYVREGISLYGVASTPQDKTTLQLDLRPVLALKAKVILIRDVPQGDFVGYDRAYQTERDSKIAILPIGYGDGFPRNLSCGKASVKIGTYIVPIIGRICMDQLAIDITDTEGVAVGDTATLIDNQENSLLSTPCVAERSDSISNEILSRMGARLPIVIKE